jgi:hypothetical protein
MFVPQSYGIADCLSTAKGVVQAQKVTPGNPGVWLK